MVMPPGVVIVVTMPGKDVIIVCTVVTPGNVTVCAGAVIVVNGPGIDTVVGGRTTVVGGTVIVVNEPEIEVVIVEAGSVCVTKMEVGTV